MSFLRRIIGGLSKRKLAAQQAEATARQETAKREEDALKRTRERQGRPLLGFLNDLIPGASKLSG